MLRLDLWPIIWSIMENVPSALEKNVYSAAIGWNYLYMSIKSIWPKLWFNSNVSLIFPLDIHALLIMRYCFLYHYCIVVYFSIKICYHLLNICWYLDIGSIFIYDCYSFLMYWLLYCYIITLFIFCFPFWPEVYFVCDNYGYTCLLSVSIWL